MKASTKIRGLLLSFALMLAAGSAWAQDPQEPPPTQEPFPESTAPKPAARGIPGLNDNSNEDQTNNDHWQLDSSPLTGFENPGIGSPQLRHSYWVPGLEYGTTIQSLPSTGWFANHYLGADFSLLQAFSRNQLGVNYSGGAFFSGTNGEGNGTYQNFTLVDDLTLGRWQIEAFDTFSYLPQSQFAFMGGTGVAIPGVGGSLGSPAPSLGGSLIPNQSIYSALGPRYSNAVAAQTTYSLSRRSSITVGGSYGLLDFTQAGNVNSNMTVANVGYNYQFNPSDSLGVFYRFSGFQYSGEPQAMGTQTVNLAYSKKLTKKMALRVFGGPQFTHFRVPVGNQSRDTNASAGASLAYSRDRESLDLTYSHALTNGGGILVGAQTDQITFAATMQLTRVWSGMVDFGYARNSPLGSTSSLAPPTFSDWFAGGGLSRPLGHTANFSINYTAQIERAACTVTPCTLNFTTNVITITLQWHSRPFVLP